MTTSKESDGRIMSNDEIVFEERYLRERFQSPERRFTPELKKSVLDLVGLGDKDKPTTEIPADDQSGLTADIGSPGTPGL